MKIEIRSVSNGYVLLEFEENDDMRPSEYRIFQEKDEGNDHILELLNNVLSTLGHSGSRHDKNRIYIITAPGDKHADFTEAMSEVIFK